ncbi:Nucleic acid-binding OB-fold [Penicillium longicatenatum]|nr:Nucleic acid-binding OB-fold [Penicillium longicatenatum]
MDGGSKNYNPYGGAGGGGGFMSGETNSPSGGKNGGGDNKTLRPVTIKQINDATSPYPEAPFQVDNADVANVLFIGRVRNISKQSTNITYIVDDYSGRVEVKKWVDAASMDIDETKGDIQLGTYVRVLGAIKSFGNKRYIAAHSLQPVTDVNQFFCSMLDATASHLFFTRGPPGGDSNGAGASAAGMEGGDNYNGHDRVLSSLSPFARDMYNLLKRESHDATGLHLQTIASRLGLPAMDIGKAGNELLNAGLIFSTLDEETWAILDY